MAHQEAGAANPPVSMTEKAAAIEDIIFAEGDPFADEEETEGEELEDDGDFDVDEDDAPEAEDDDSDEPGQPAIEPPVSLNAEEKEVFAQLPPEAQQAWAASETRRNQQVQEATTRASQAQRAAEQQAAMAQRNAEARFGEQLRAYTAVFEPQAPDPARYHDMHAYQRDKAIYDHQKAQHDELVQRVSVIGVETAEQKAQRIAQRDAALRELIPDITDPEKGVEMVRQAFALAGEFGFDVQTLTQDITAEEFQFLAQATKWKADSEELARIRAKSRERVRDGKTGKFKSMKPGSAPSGQPGRNSEKAFRKLQSVRGNRAKEGEAAADWLERAGYL